MSAKWRTLLLLALAEFLAMSVWFSASAVVPALTDAWGLDDSGRAWLTMSVQIGFVAGALGSAILNLADRLPARLLFAISAVLAGVATALIPLLTTSLLPALFLRFMTGLFLAGVYPVGMKIMATWTQRDRGLAIGLLVGALTVGSAAPHLINALGGFGAWQPVLYVAAALALGGGFIGILFIDEGPYKTASPPFNWRYAGHILRERELLLANFGYLGHMWELYAMWTWMAAFLAASAEAASDAYPSVSIMTFSVIAVGGIGAALAGLWADRVGRTRVAGGSMVISGACALATPVLFGASWSIVFPIVLIWGATVVSDSAQFSAMATETSAPEVRGTALTLQTAAGFLLTLITIRGVPLLAEALTWRWAFPVLAAGPAFGVWAMVRLRRSPAAVQLAGGRG